MVCRAGLRGERLRESVDFAADGLGFSDRRTRMLHSALDNHAARLSPVVGMESPRNVCPSWNARFQTRATADCVLPVATARDRDVHAGESANKGDSRTS
jgi:hypothetical protein